MSKDLAALHVERKEQKEYSSRLATQLKELVQMREAWEHEREEQQGRIQELERMERKYTTERLEWERDAQELGALRLCPAKEVEARKKVQECVTLEQDTRTKLQTVRVAR